MICKKFFLLQAFCLTGYVAGSASLIDYSRNRVATWIYTIGLWPADTAVALKAVKILQSELERRHHLWENIAYLGKD